MARVVWNYEINPEGGMVLLPICAKLVAFDIQNRTPMVWAEVDPNEGETERRWFAVYGTGHEIPEQESGFSTRRMELRHRFTCQDGASVWHLYEDINYE